MSQSVPNVLTSLFPTAGTDLQGSDLPVDQHEEATTIEFSVQRPPEEPSPSPSPTPTATGEAPSSLIDGSAGRPDVVVDPEFADLIMPQSKEEQYLLELSLRQEGCRDPLVVWPSEGGSVLLDGHLRHKLCNQYNIAYTVRCIELPNREAALDWILTNQLARRNFTPLQTAYYRGQRYNALKTSHGGKRSGRAESVASQEKTAVRLATTFAVSDSTIRRDGEFAGVVDRIGAVCGNKVKRDLLLGKTPLSRERAADLVKRNPNENDLKQAVQDAMKVRRAPIAAKPRQAGQSVGKGDVKPQAVKIDDTCKSELSGGEAAGGKQAKPGSAAGQPDEAGELAVAGAGGDTNATEASEKRPEASPPTDDGPIQVSDGGACAPGGAATLVVPSEAPALARTLVERLGLEAAREVHRLLGELLKAACKPTATRPSRQHRNMIPSAKRGRKT